MSLGNHLFEARKKRGLSQEEVAGKLGVSRQTISKWETDETLPDIRQSKRLAALYGLSLDELVGIAKKSETPSCAEENPEPAKPEPAKPSPAFSRKTVMIAFTIVVAVMIAVNVAVWMFIYRSLEQKSDNTPIHITLSDMDSTDLNSLNSITFEE